MVKASHTLCGEFPEETARLIMGHFDGSLKNVWEPTVYGDYQFHEDEKPPKKYVPLVKK
jgi:hypothetical protein